MSSRFGLKTRTAIIFALVFAAFAIAAASANYVLLRQTLDTGQGRPSVEELSSALQEVAADDDRSLPEFVSSTDGARLILGTADAGVTQDPADSSSELFPLIDQRLEGGQFVTAEVDRWLSARDSSTSGDVELELSDENIPADAAALDGIILQALASLEPLDPGVTSDLLVHLALLRVEGGGALFPAPVRGDGDICRAIFVNCDQALAELNELATLATDEEFISLLDEALTLASQRTRDQALASQLRISTIVALLSTIGAGAAAWFVTRRMLRPITDVTTAARNASVHNLGSRIGHVGPADELQELAETFDEMLGRLQRSFESSSRFGSNAAHELKTPLAVLRAEIDAHRADPETELREQVLLDRLELAVERSDRLVTSLLSLSRAEAGLQLEEMVDLPNMVTTALLDNAELLSERGLSVDYQVGDLPQDNAEIQGDPALLSTLVHNLVENAAKYAVTGSEIEVEIAHLAGALRLRVENRCETIDVEDPMTLIEPFNRGSARVGVGGYGLGLSIVGAIARAHNAPIAVRFRDGSYGLVITVDFDSAPGRGVGNSLSRNRTSSQEAGPPGLRPGSLGGTHGSI